MKSLLFNMPFARGRLSPVRNQFQTKFNVNFQNQTKIVNKYPILHACRIMRCYSTPSIPPGEKQIEQAITSNSSESIDVSKAIDSLEKLTQQSTQAMSSNDSLFLWFQPVSWALDLMEIIHQFTGTPWWGTIVLTTISLRFMLLPLAIKAIRHSSQVVEYQPQLTELQTEMLKAKDAGNLEKQEKITERILSGFSKSQSV